MYSDQKAFASAQRLTSDATRQFVFLLLPCYSPMDVMLAIEVLNEANKAGANPAYSWKVYSENGLQILSQSGMSLSIEETPSELSGSAAVIVCGGKSMQAELSPSSRQWIRKAARHGSIVGGVGGGTAALARVGLLSGQRISAHWSVISIMREAFPTSDIHQSLFEMSDRVMTCPGGLATLDMFIAMVARQHGTTCAQDAAASLTCSHIRDQDSAQTLSPSCQFGTRNEHLIAAIEIMKENVEYPLSPMDIADQVGASCRQLERLFSRHVGMSPKKYSNKLRLDHARDLLQRTRMSILEVALACGFTSASHFSKLFRKRFGRSPNEERGVAIH